MTESHAREPDARKSHYRRLLVMTVMSFMAMYVLMYAMVDRFANVYMNFNQVYMAGLMTAAMVVIELAVMRGMYSDRRWNSLIAAGSFVAVIGLYLLIRSQAAIGDQQFVSSMIPHHAGAILMCERAPIRDSEIKELCKAIVSSQQSEIDWMTAKLRQLEK